MFGFGIVDKEENPGRTGRKGNSCLAPSCQYTAPLLHPLSTSLADFTVVDVFVALGVGTCS